MSGVFKKQIIDRYSDGSINYKYYENDRGERHGLLIYYRYNNNLWWKTNWFNDKKYGLQTWWNSNGGINEQKYYL